MEFISGKGQSKRDEESLNILFTSLGFNVKIHQYLTAQQMITNVESYSEMQHEGVFLLIILSLGTLVDNQVAVLGTDNKAVKIHHLETLFHASSCSSLIGIPKIFLIDAFQDDKNLIPEYTESMATKQSLACPDRTDMWDFAIIYTLTFEYVAHATNSGSWFTQIIVKVITEAIPCISFTKIIQEVKARVQRSNTHQMVECVDRLTRDYFIKRYISLLNSKLTKNLINSLLSVAHLWQKFKS